MPRSAVWSAELTNSMDSPISIKSRSERQQQPTTPPRPASEIQVPKMKFGNAEISRLVCGANQFYGFAHFNQILGTIMQEYYTPARVCELLHQCNEFGINAMVFHTNGRGSPDVERFRAEGGQIKRPALGGLSARTDYLHVHRLKPAQGLLPNRRLLPRA